MSRPRHSPVAAVAAGTLALALAPPSPAAAPPTGPARFEAFLHRTAPARAGVSALAPGPGLASVPAAGALGGPAVASVSEGAAGRAATPLVVQGGTPLPATKVTPPTVNGFFIPARVIDVASAGDVDGNGTTDWIRGEAYADAGPNTQAGHVTITRNLPGGPVTTDLFGPAAFANFGGAVASAGDVNGDGFDEVIVGAASYDGSRGSAFVYRGTASGTLASPSWTIGGVAAQDFAGYSVAGAGDVNGDGFDDVLVGSPGWSSGAVFERGRVSCYLGSGTGLSTIPAWTVEGTNAGEWLGFNIAGNGDVNADGYADVLVASPFFANGQVAEGAFHLYLGGPAGLAPTAAWTFETNNAFWGAEASCALPGDVNGDGYGDVVLGLPGADVGGSDDGQVFVFGGSAFTFFLPQLGFLYGGTTGMKYGFDVAPAGDLNGDGFADFLATAPFYNAGDGLWTENYGASNYGAISSFLVRNGSTSSNSGIAATGGGDDGSGVPVYLLGVANYVDAAPGAPDPDAVLGFGVPAMFVEPGITLDELGYMPAQAFAQGSYLETGFGQSLAFADVNGDGFSDLIAGGPNYDEGLGDQGHVQAYYGKADELTPPIIFSRKGGGDEMAGVPTFAAPDWTFTSPYENANVGWAVANAGDVNGDGYEDVIVGAPGYSAPDAAEGAAFLFLGGADGLASLPEWQTEGNAFFQLYGYGVGSAGDVNQDGYDDILVGAPLASPGAVSGAGAVNLFYGSPSGPAHTPARVFAGGGPDVHLGAACLGIGDVDNDGYPDIAMSEVDYGNGQSNEGRILAYRGGPGGVATLPFFTWESDHALSTTGLRLAPAGDLNGDGFADLLVPSFTWSNGESEEGAVHVFAGSALGLGTAPVQTLESNDPGVHFGQDLWTAGDLDKDGYGDVLVGSPNFGVVLPIQGPGGPATDGPTVADGRADIFFGSAFGLESSPRISFTSGSTGFAGNIGFGLAGGGDLNGDGWPDVAYAAPLASYGKIFQDGIVSKAYGNVMTRGLARPTRTLRSDNFTPIALGLRSDLPTSFRVAGQARTPAGRGRVRLQWQAKTPGAPLDGTGLGTSAALRTSVPSPSGSSIPLSGSVSGLATGQRYRLRMRYTTRHPYFPRSPWFSAHRNGVLETDLRTAGPTGFVGVGGESGGALSFAGAWPNPLAGAGTLAYALPRAGRVTIDAYDAGGRHVSRVLDGEAAAGPGATTWNGRDDAGRALPRGLYFLRLSFDGDSRTAKVVLAP